MLRIIPVAMITAHGSVETAISALKAGAFDFISKPIELERLRTLVGTALKDPAHPIEVEHVVRSFDPCLVCTVHVVDAR